MLVIHGEVVPIKSWCLKPEDSAIDQAQNLARLPFIYKHVCLMPDTHCGYGMPIGGVIATIGSVIPNAVGVDIGCGMCAIKSNIKVESLDTSCLKSIMGGIRKSVPVGFNHNKIKCDEKILPPFDDVMFVANSIVLEEREKARYQIGTLGGGNHFIEIQRDTDNYLWVMIHSGSRNLGKRVADHYNKVAIELNAKWHSKVDPKWELAFLPVNSMEGENYLIEMQFCVDFALHNRRKMMETICGVIYDNCPHAKFDDMINIAHNYARMENHFGKNVMVHRKGATSARTGEIGIIPGSQGSKSYIVCGKGNKDSFESCSHGAGRAMSRGRAIETLSLENEIQRMDNAGIVHGIRNKQDLDEAPSAYKDIDVVMSEQSDLVDIYKTLFPIGVIKG